MQYAYQFNWGFRISQLQTFKYGYLLIDLLTYNQHRIRRYT